MQLRSDIRTLTRHDDQFDLSNMPRTNQITTPRYPDLLKRSIGPVNPDPRPAAFPSLPLSTFVSGGQPRAIDDRIRPCTPSSFTEDIDSASRSDDDKSNFELQFDQADPVSWSFLELSVQCQIFARLSLYHTPHNAAALLGLTPEEDSRIHQDMMRRKQCQLFNHDASNYLGESSSLGIAIHDFAEAYPLSVQRATRFLRERGLAQSLLGEWHLSADGSGMLICSDFQTCSASMGTPPPDSGYFSGSEDVADTPIPSPSGLTNTQNSFGLTRTGKLKAHKEACQQRPSLLLPIEPAQPSLQTNNKRQHQSPVHHLEDTDTLQADEPPKKASKRRRSHRPPPIQTKPPPTPWPLSMARSPPGPDRGESGRSLQRSAGRINLRNRDKIRPTEKKQEMANGFWMDLDVVPSDEQSAAASYQCSPFVTLKVPQTPRLSISPDTGLAKVLGKPTKMLHDAKHFTSTFRQMPQDEQDRLLSVHPLDRNIIQTWLIYGKDTWNQKFKWSGSFAKNHHGEGPPGAGEQWDVGAAGSVLCKSLVAQRNLCQELGLDDEFFQTAGVGQKVIKCYEAISRKREEIDKAFRGKHILHSQPAESFDEYKKAQELCKQIEKNLWDTLRLTYATRVPDLITNALLANKLPTKVILFDDELEEQPVDTSRAHLQPSLTENAFTSKALGVSLEQDPVNQDWSPLPSCSGAFEDGACENTELCSSPLIRKHQRNLKAEKRKARSGLVTEANDAASTPTRSRNSLSAGRREFSPIPEDEARQFAIEFDKLKNAEKAAVSMNRISPAPKGQPSFFEPAQGVITSEYGNELSSTTGGADKQGPKTASTKPKRTKITLKVSPSPSVQEQTATQQRSIVKRPAHCTPKPSAQTPSLGNTKTGSSHKSMRLIETRAQKAFREDKPSAHTRSRVSTPDHSWGKPGYSSTKKERKSVSVGNKAVKASKK